MSTASKWRRGWTHWTHTVFWILTVVSWSQEKRDAEQGVPGHIVELVKSADLGGKSISDIYFGDTVAVFVIFTGNRITATRYDYSVDANLWIYTSRDIEEYSGPDLLKPPEDIKLPSVHPKVIAGSLPEIVVKFIGENERLLDKEDYTFIRYTDKTVTIGDDSKEVTYVKKIGGWSPARVR